MTSDGDEGIRVRNLDRVWAAEEVCHWRRFLRQVATFMKPRRLRGTGEKGTERNRFLFRGVPDRGHDLKPSIARLTPTQKGAVGQQCVHYLHMVESAATNEFKKRAHLYQHNRLPSNDDDNVAWWQLMQHYGAATRLLDWTGSPYVAAYFAVEKDWEADGIVYMIDHGAHQDRMKEMYPRQFTDNEPSFPQLPSGGLDCQYERYRLLFAPVAQPNPRSAAQQGLFSCAFHIDVDHGEAIAEAYKTVQPPNGHWSKALVIRAKDKPEFLRQLWYMNISGETLYTGLEGLGRLAANMTSLLLPYNGLRYHYEDGLLARSKPDNP